MKLEQGDIFESTNADWLRRHLPHYEQIWAAFIGHDGTGWPCEMPGLDQAAQTARKRFYQAHYSFACTIRRLAKLSEELDHSLGVVSDYAAFEAESDRLFRYASYLGHVRDMFKIMEEALACHGKLYATLQDFYAQRSHLLHGPRLPVRIVDGFLMIPKVGGENKVFG